MFLLLCLLILTLIKSMELEESIYDNSIVIFSDMQHSYFIVILINNEK